MRHARVHASSVGRSARASQDIVSESAAWTIGLGAAGAALAASAPFLFAGVAGGWFIKSFFDRIDEAREAGAGEGVGSRALLAAASDLSPVDVVGIGEALFGVSWMAAGMSGPLSAEDRSRALGGSIGGVASGALATPRGARPNGAGKRMGRDLGPAVRHLTPEQRAAVERLSYQFAREVELMRGQFDRSSHANESLISMLAHEVVQRDAVTSEGGAVARDLKLDPRISGHDVDVGLPEVKSIAEFKLSAFLDEHGRLRVTRHPDAKPSAQLSSLERFATENPDIACFVISGPGHRDGARTIFLYEPARAEWIPVYRDGWLID